MSRKKVTEQPLDMRLWHMVDIIDRLSEAMELITEVDNVISIEQDTNDIGLAKYLEGIDLFTHSEQLCEDLKRLRAIHKEIRGC